MSFLWWFSSFATTPEYSSISFTDTNKDNYEFSAQHFQQTLFLEDVSVSFSTGEEIPQLDFDSFLSNNFSYQHLKRCYCLPTKYLSSKAVDRKQKILQQLFPFHFFF